MSTGALALPHWASVSSINSSKDSGRGSGIPEPSLMTTCVGSLSELQDLIGRMQPRIPLCPQAMRALFYFMRCSQLEHGEQGGSAVQVKSNLRAINQRSPRLGMVDKWFTKMGLDFELNLMELYSVDCCSIAYILHNIQIRIIVLLLVEIICATTH